MKFVRKYAPSFSISVSGKPVGGMNVDALVSDPRLSAVIGMMAEDMKCDKTESKEMFLLFLLRRMAMPAFWPITPWSTMKN